MSRLLTRMLPVLAAAVVACGEAVEQDGATADSAAVADPVLRNELVRMGLLDQTARAGMTVDFMADTAYARATMAIDSILTRRLRRIIGQSGWPLRSRVGNAAAEAAFLILQHSPSDAFQRETLPLVVAAATAGEASASDVAMLTDRVLTHEGKPQLYGSQFRIVDGELVPFPIEDPEGLDERRAKVGLPPMAEYVRLLGDMYKGPVRWPVDSAGRARLDTAQLRSRGS